MTTTKNELQTVSTFEQPHSPSPEQTQHGRLETLEKKTEQQPPAGEMARPAEMQKGLGNFLKIKRRPKVILPLVRDDTTVKIEKILEDGLNDAYARLSPIAQQEFKLKGEEAAFTIRELLKNTHVKVKKIFRLILEWLKILPGINRFFLEQEAKIKADKIIALHSKK